LALAHHLADVAAETALRLVDGGSFAVRTKADGTPVTDVDDAVEDAVRAELAAQRPLDAMLGEERGQTGDGARRWIIDAIDGTGNLVAGSPMWATLVALEVDEALVVGVLSAPMFGRRWWAERGSSAWRTKNVAQWQAMSQRVRVSDCSSLENARAAVLPDSDGVVPEHVTHVISEACSVVDVAGHPALLVAQGELEVSVHLGGGPWDHAALAVIVTEAGGAFSDFRGQPRIDAGSVVFTNGALHEAALAVVSTIG
jgi:histidinol-phosphatase